MYPAAAVSRDDDPAANDLSIGSLIDRVVILRVTAALSWR
jgi:hypothetical protein